MLKYFNYNDVFSRQCILNFIIGPRSIGKTYGIKQYMLRHNQDKGEQFIYLRQNKQQILDTIDWLGKLAEKYPQYEQKKNQIINTETGEPAVLMYGLSQYLSLKSQEFPKVKGIVLDEFTDRQPWMNRTPKPEALLNLADSVFRNDDKGKWIICLGNASTIGDNEYLNYFNIQVDPKRAWTQIKNDILLYLHQDSAFSQERVENTRLGRLTQRTEYGKMALENRFEDESTENLKNLPKGARPLLSVKDTNQVVTLYETPQNDIIITLKANVKADLSVVVDASDLSIDNYYKVINDWRYEKILRRIKEKAVFYDTRQARAEAKKTLQVLGLV